MKARNLQILKDNGFLVPPFIVVNDVEDLPPCKTFLLDDDKTYAVRSSFSMEDGAHCSFAGQFTTKLNVNKEDIPQAIEEIKNGFSVNNIQQYAKNVSNSQLSITKNESRVIIQQMVDAEYAGVIFTANPLGILNETVIVVGEGLGENVVEDKVHTTTYYYNHDDKIIHVEQNENSPELQEHLIKKLLDNSKRIKKIFGCECDIEFAIAHNHVYILQTRPITTLNTDNPIILDNSNIVESYPHISLPLTQDFVKKAYYDIFYNCVKRITGSQQLADQMDAQLQNMVDIANWRIYYRISNWYSVLQLLPMSKKIIPMWQRMMGVNNPYVASSQNTITTTTRFQVLKNFIYYLNKTPQLMGDLNQNFDNRFAAYKQQVQLNNSIDALLETYNNIQEDILKDWDLTLVNDMYAFIYTAIAGKRHKEMLSNIKNLESMKPVLEIEKLIQIVQEHGFDSKEYNAAKEKHIELYGDRCLGELKLETKTYRTNPEMLDNYIKAHLNNPPLSHEDPHTSKDKWSVRKAKLGIKNREISRMNRSRLYGLIREIFLKIGESLVQSNRLEDKTDVFYLYIHEISEPGLNMKDLVQERKRQYEIYEHVPAYSRLVFADRIVNSTRSTVETKFEKSSILIGTPTSSGVVKGEVIVIDNPSDTIDASNKIIVTHSTDPGWVFLIQNAIGIIAEKGSLLSHTAIISRELHKPAIVNVKDCTKVLSTGNIVQLDANEGRIIIVERE